MNFKEARRGIDEINREMLKLLLKRNELSKVIAREKKERGLAIEDPSREEEILKAMVEMSPEHHEEIETFFKCLFELSKEVQRKEVNEMKDNHQNIVLIGMPGVGKTTVAKILHERTGRTHYEVDREIEENMKMGIPEIFEIYGEQGFRQFESAMLSKLSDKEGVIIDTGGGAVTTVCNQPMMQKNARIYWIKRPLEELATEGRPLSQGGIERLREIYKVREPMYQRFCDLEVENTTPEACADEILEDFYGI